MAKSTLTKLAEVAGIIGVFIALVALMYQISDAKESSQITSTTTLEKSKKKTEVFSSKRTVFEENWEKAINIESDLSGYSYYIPLIEFEEWSVRMYPQNTNYKPDMFKFTNYLENTTIEVQSSNMSYGSRGEGTYSKFIEWRLVNEKPFAIIIGVGQDRLEDSGWEDFNISHKIILKSLDGKIYKTFDADGAFSFEEARSFADEYFLAKNKEL